eukprot:FR734739.1.p1 GENE.FR734739.1~~FR734739.1.p1  ORF type:complete len:135 (+),score=14.25 FR734739.1:46-405(+)
MGLGLVFLVLVAFFGIGFTNMLELALYVPAVLKSIKAIEASPSAEGKHMLSFWLVYCAVTIMDPLIRTFLFWVPYFWFFKSLLLQYCLHVPGIQSVISMASKKIQGMLAPAATDGKKPE